MLLLLEVRAPEAVLSQIMSLDARELWIWTLATMSSSCLHMLPQTIHVLVVQGGMRLRQSAGPPL